MQTKLDEQQRVISSMFDANAKFCRHHYFIDKMWKKVKGYENADEADVKAAFMSAWLFNDSEIMTMPIGCGWAAIISDKEDFDKYMAEYQPLFSDYVNWCYMQR